MNQYNSGRIMESVSPDRIEDIVSKSPKGIVLTGENCIEAKRNLLKEVTLSLNYEFVILLFTKPVYDGKTSDMVYAKYWQEYEEPPESIRID